MRTLKPGTSWDDTWSRCRRAAPEAFDADRANNLVDGEWSRVGHAGTHTTPLDGSAIPGAPFVGVAEAEAAVASAVSAHRKWSRVDLDERRARVLMAIESMATGRACWPSSWCGRSANPGDWPGRTWTVASTGSGGTWARSSAS